MFTLEGKPMMRVRVEEIRKGLHPQEVVVSVATRTGSSEHLVVHRRSLNNGSLAIGYPISESDENYLVELPHETTSGAWRVWVPKDAVVTA
jgi:hypothetical protein